jgi:uncharacterized protein YrrD
MNNCIEECAVDISLGMHVYTSDGHDAGTIDRLVLDPATNHVKSAVVHKGSLLTRDVQIPLDQLQVRTDGTVHIALSSRQLHELPQFYDEKFMAPPSSYIPPSPSAADELYITTGAPVPELEPIATSPTGPEDVTSEARAAFFKEDLANAVVGEDSAVVARDGASIGHVHSLIFHPHTGVLESIVVRHGFFFTHDTTLSAELIDSIDDGVITLKIDAANAQQ